MHPATGCSTVTLALICSFSAMPGLAQTAHTPPVIAQELANVRASGKVMTALWTSRRDTYTLQLVFPFNPPAMARPTRTAAPAPNLLAQQPIPARVQVWLLKADGTQIFPAHGTAAPQVEGFPGNLRSTAYTYTYTFPVESGKAVAIAVSINDQFYIDQLKPLR